MLKTKKELKSFKREIFFKESGATKSEGKCILRDGRETLNKAPMRQILAVLHQESHWEVQAMCAVVLRKYVCVGIYTLVKQICRGCTICQKVNKKVIRNPPRGGREPGIRPFQSIQVDFTELPKAGRLKYLFVLIDHVTGWM